MDTVTSLCIRTKEKSSCWNTMNSFALHTRHTSEQTCCQMRMLIIIPLSVKMNSNSVKHDRKTVKFSAQWTFNASKNLMARVLRASCKHYTCLGKRKHMLIELLYFMHMVYPFLIYSRKLWWDICLCPP